mgnify:CR=1 FL=1
MSAETVVETPNMAQKFWRWQPMTAALLLMAVELMWVTPWYRLVSQLSIPPPLWKTTLILAVVLSSAYLISYGMEALRLLRSIRLGALGALLALQLIFVPLALMGGQSPITTAEGILRLDLGYLLAITTVLWLWRRGATLGSALLRPGLAWQRFGQGLLALLAYSFVSWQVQPAGVQSQGDFLLFSAYLFIGLLAVTLTRIAFVSGSVRQRKNPFDRRWLLSVCGVLGLVISIAALVGSLLTGQYQLLLQAASVILRGALVVGLFLLSLPALLFSFLIYPLALLIQRLPRQTPTPESDLLGPGGAYPPYPMEASQGGPLPLPLQVLCLFSVLALVVLFVYLRTRKTLSQTAVILPEGPESLLEEGDAARLARQALQDWFEGLAQRLRPRARPLIAVRIRQIYAQLLQLCSELRTPRPDSATPLEFLPRMAEVFPDREQDLQTITQLYLRVRYGEYPETLTDVQRVEAAWQRIAEEGERRKKKKMDSASFRSQQR